jgi:CBS domain-containing protein
VHTFLEQSVADHMTREVKTVSPVVTVRELGEQFKKDDFNAYPVVENAHVVGLVSKFDYLACFIFTPAHMIPRYQELLKQTVADIMTPDFIYVGIDTRLTRVLQLMVEHRIRSMPVLADEHRLAGMIARGDVMLALQNSGREAADSMAGQRGIRLDD